MAERIDTGTRAFTPGAALAQHARVKITSGKLALAGVGASDEPVEIGTMEHASFGDESPKTVSVVLRSKQGTSKMIAAAAITAGVAVYGAANGKVSSTASGTAIGVALEAATADNDVIEVLRY
ncbi:MAG: DUF2190 family protein [Pirellulales bacterium]|nr:DUF2190 family protein [Pirellulales bacterium]